MDRRTWENTLGLGIILIALTIGIAYIIFGSHNRKACDRACNLAQCACVETCPHERGE
jgi:hypothetical protein